MTPEKFVQEFCELKEDLLKEYFSQDSEISRINKLIDAGLNKNQINLTEEIVSEVLTDALYTVLLGLDGCTSISKHQILYELKDEYGNLISGDMENYAWEQFHGKGT